MNNFILSTAIPTRIAEIINNYSYLNPSLTEPSRFLALEFLINQSL